MRSNDPIYVYDARLLERHVRQGLIAESDVHKFVQSLPDRAENAEALGIPFESVQAPATQARRTT